MESKEKRTWEENNSQPNARSKKINNEKNNPS